MYQYLLHRLHVVSSLTRGLWALLFVVLLNRFSSFVFVRNCLQYLCLGQCRTICLQILSVHLDSHLPLSVYLSFLFWTVQSLFSCSILSGLFSFSHTTPYFFLPPFLSIFLFFFAAIRIIKKSLKVQTDICRLLCKSFLFHLKSVPTPLPDSENYVCRGLCQEDVPCQTVFSSCWQLAVFLDDSILEHFPAAITSGVERCISLRAVCQAHQLHEVPESVYQTNTFHQDQSIYHSVLHLRKATITLKKCLALLF